MLGSMQGRTDKCFRPSTEAAAQFNNRTKDSDWESLAQCRTIARVCALFKSYSGERAWKVIGDRLRRAYCLSRTVMFGKLGTGSNERISGSILFVNRNIKNWNRLPAEVLGTFRCKPKIFRNRVRKATVNGVKLKEKKCGENHLKSQRSEVRWSVVMWGEIER